MQLKQLGALASHARAGGGAAGAGDQADLRDRVWAPGFASIIFSSPRTWPSILRSPVSSRWRTLGRLAVGYRAGPWGALTSHPGGAGASVPPDADSGHG